MTEGRDAASLGDVGQGDVGLVGLDSDVVEHRGVRPACVCVYARMHAHAGTHHAGVCVCVEGGGKHRTGLRSNPGVKEGGREGGRERKGVGVGGGREREPEAGEGDVGEGEGEGERGRRGRERERERERE